ncbi:heterokaryon incompatibility protein-domain-containing protein [Xylariaceae sp. FL1651]|nr:heterokaryon incompatibility protein-domain-containing protein [Xylariaceae sp. FL1651]
MRLLNTQTRQIHNFVSQDDIKEFAILSHTWGPEEVTFQDWQQLSPAELELKEGYRKINSCCNQALEDGYLWVWVDTCCIDKTSSAELSEAINSMFRWYQDSAICYAHIADVSDDTNEDSLLSSLAKSRWVTRGWTLQELLAPRDIVFFSENWHKLTTKLDSISTLSSITGIDESFLDGAPLENASAAKKMSWAAQRKTTRVEDIAYCLLGIFDVNMPLIYGEGKKAFKRLQEEIMKANPEDHTLFAWGEVVEKMVDIPYLIVDNEKPAEVDKIPWEASKVTQPLSGLLAESPSDFRDSGGFIIANIATKFYKHAPRGVITSLPQIQDKSIRLQLPIQYNCYQSICYWEQPQIVTLRSTAVAVLLCCHEKAPTFLPAIPLRSCGEKSFFSRTREICSRYTMLSTSVRPPIFKYREMLNIEPQRPLRIESGDIMLRRYIWGKETETLGWWAATKGQPVSEGIVKMRGVKNGPICVLYNRVCQVSCRHGFGVKLERIEKDEKEMGGISAAVVPLDIGPGEGKKNEPLKPDFDLKWNPRSQCMRCEIIPGFKKILDTPSDTAVFDILPFPVITVKIERVLLKKKGDEDDGFVDVLDVVITERELSYYPKHTEDGHKKNH